jgi:hypothetical protein
VFTCAGNELVIYRSECGLLLYELEAWDDEQEDDEEEEETVSRNCKTHVHIRTYS